MASGTIMPRDQLLMSQKFTWNHLPMSSTSQGMVGPDGHAGELEGQIGLDGGVHFRGAAMVNVPAAVGQLHGEDVVHRLALPFGIHLPMPVMIGDRVGNERGIHHQFPDPKSFRLLFGQQETLRPLKSGLHAVGKYIWHGRGGQGGRLHP
jgi:hypothetical protein